MCQKDTSMIIQQCLTAAYLIVTHDDFLFGEGKRHYMQGYLLQTPCKCPTKIPKLVNPSRTLPTPVTL